MEPFEREILLEKVEREGRVGDSVPETVDITSHLDEAPPAGYGGADAFALADYVLDAKRGDAGGVDDVVTALRRKRTALVGRLEDDPLTVEEGREIVDSVRGIDRALNALGQPGGPAGLDEEAAQQEKADQQRWMNFLKKVTGAGSGDDRRRHG